MHKVKKQIMAAPDVKQVILVRNDLKMSPGKVAAHVGHAAILFLINAIYEETFEGFPVKELQWMFGNGPIPWTGQDSENEKATIYGGMKKIVLGVDTYLEFQALLWAAENAGLKVFSVFDEGVNDITAMAIGPDYAEKIDTITGKLDLYGPAPSDKDKYRLGADGRAFDMKFTFAADKSVSDTFNQWAVAQAIVPKKRYRY
jgi:peptidyl-tRNA hydrolase, PTH2 family